MSTTCSTTCESMSDGMSNSRTSLLDLPLQVLADILGWLHDVYDVCSAARTCKLLLKLSSSPALWSHHTPGGLIERAAQQLLSSVLHLPPQAFHVHMVPHVSRTFPVNVPLNNLRGILGCSDATHLAEQVSTSIQDILASLKPHQRVVDASGPSPPQYAIFGVCRADGGQVRLSLNHSVAVPMLLQHIACLPDVRMMRHGRTQHQGHEQVLQRAVHAVQRLSTANRDYLSNATAGLTQLSNISNPDVSDTSDYNSETMNEKMTDRVRSMTGCLAASLAHMPPAYGGFLLSSNRKLMTYLAWIVVQMLSALFPGHKRIDTVYAVATYSLRAAIQQAVIQRVTANVWRGEQHDTSSEANSGSRTAGKQPGSVDGPGPVSGNLPAVLLAELSKVAHLDDALLCCTHLETFLSKFIGSLQSQTPGATTLTVMRSSTGSQLTSLSLNELVFRPEQSRGFWDPRIQSQRTTAVNTPNSTETVNATTSTSTQSQLQPKLAKELITQLLQQLDTLQSAVFDNVLAPAKPSKTSLGLFGLRVWPLPNPEQACGAMLQGLSDAALHCKEFLQQLIVDQTQAGTSTTNGACTRNSVLSDAVSAAVAQGVEAGGSGVEQSGFGDVFKTDKEQEQLPLVNNHWEPDRHRALLRWCLLLAFTKCTNWYLYILDLDDLLA